MADRHETSIDDVALIFEGGGMRNSYSAGVVNVLLESGLRFANVYGLSAGATNAVDYISRDSWRSRVNFTEYTDGFVFRRLVLRWMREPKAREDRAPHEQGLARSGTSVPLDFDAFRSSDIRLTMQALERDTGNTAYFTNEHFHSEQALRSCVQASSSYPGITAPKRLEGQVYYDGGIGEGGGIMLPRARADGFERFFVVRTRPRGFRKPEEPNRLYDAYFWHRPAMRRALDTWARRYNATLDELDVLEARGSAYVFHAEGQGVSNTERDVGRLKANFERGYCQARSEVDGWLRFLA